MIERQAKYVAQKIKMITEKKKYRDINIVSHSLGSYVAYQAIDDEAFPK